MYLPTHLAPGTVLPLPKAGTYAAAIASIRPQPVVPDSTCVAKCLGPTGSLTPLRRLGRSALNALLSSALQVDVGVAVLPTAPVSTDQVIIEKVILIIIIHVVLRCKGPLKTSKKQIND